MMTFEEMMAAANDHQPWQALDDLVNRELERGQTVEEIRDLFVAWMRVFDALNPSENASESFGDTYDRLIGNCRPADRFQSPHRILLTNANAPASIPTEVSPTLV